MMTADRARTIARIGGVLYLAVIATGALGEAFVRGSIVVAGDAAATAANLRLMEWLWRLGLAGEVLLLTCSAILAAILYALLHRVNREVAIAAVLLNVIALAVEAVAALSLLSALAPIGPQSYLSAFTGEQLNALTMLSIRTHTVGFALALAFFGVECVLLGSLIYRSRYMPKLVGGLMAIGGACYVTNSLAVVLSPAVAGLIFPLILLPALVAELSLALWLLFRGVRMQEWNAARA